MVTEARHIPAVPRDALLTIILITIVFLIVAGENFSQKSGYAI